MIYYRILTSSNKRQDTIGEGSAYHSRVSKSAPFFSEVLVAQYSVPCPLDIVLSLNL